MNAIITTKQELSEVLTEILPGSLKKANQTVNPEKLYTIAEAARLLGKAYTTVIRMKNQDRIKVTADGKYISQKAIDNYLNA